MKNSRYKCPACNTPEQFNKKGESNMIRLQYSPISGWHLRCICGTKTELMPWGEKPHDAWYIKQQE